FVSILSALTPGPWGRARDGSVVEIKAARRIDFLRSASETLRWLEEKKQEVEKLKMELALRGVVEE
ncbi:MAG: hypothetical protein PHZ19_10550, partial [Candidatus Thermoplasmatota archaeon]|nr:hypothetical protein [Candidatus Thermoplasmatota archaeon]